MVPPTSTGGGGGPEGELAYHRVPQRREKDQFTKPYKLSRDGEADSLEYTSGSAQGHCVKVSVKREGNSGF